MSGLPWFRMYSEFATDPVVQILDHADQRHYVMILCMKCNGTLDRAISDDNKTRIIARVLGLDLVATEAVKRKLLDLRFIDVSWQPRSWKSRQFESDNSTDRVRKYRNNKKAGNVSETRRNSFCNAPDTDTDTDPPIVPQGDDHFARFWTLYPRKDDKKKAVIAWRKIKGDEHAKIFAALDVLNASPEWRNRDRNLIPMPTTWLNGRRWEDEAVTLAATKRDSGDPVWHSSL